jgi:uncharacterized membrane protein SpoIIM required for sporulation
MIEQKDKSKKFVKRSSRNSDALFFYGIFLMNRSSAKLITAIEILACSISFILFILNGIGVTHFPNFVLPVFLLAESFQ